MTQLAIKGHPTRGKEVIEILEMLGGKIRYDRLKGNACFRWYYINKDGYIDYKHYSLLNDTTIFTLEGFLEKFPYKVGDKVLLEGIVKTIKQVCWSNTENEVIYKLETNVRGFSEEYYVHHYDLRPYKEETMESKPNLLQQLKDYFDNTPRDVLEKEWNEYDKYNEIGPTVNEYLEYVNRSRQPQYPKTYEECCDVLFPHSIALGKVLASGYNCELLKKFGELLICRDAYWKIAGEQMGLGKPWNQDYNDRCFVIANNNGNIHTYEYHGSDNVILAFPTKEIRDDFFENFGYLIEICKELL